ncbi:MAG: prepilin-type N-terminal cleavage/methylation domain-containing protein [bacterium]
MSTKKSFTLIEMLIVVVIIGILAAALIPRLQSVQARARDTKRKADLHQIGTAMAIYKEDNGNYNPLWQAYPNVQYMGTFFIADNNPNHQTNHNTTGINEVLERYMTSIPMDPTLSTSWRDANYDPIY